MINSTFLPYVNSYITLGGVNRPSWRVERFIGVYRQRVRKESVISFRIGSVVVEQQTLICSKSLLLKSSALTIMELQEYSVQFSYEMFF